MCLLVCIIRFLVDNKIPITKICDMASFDIPTTMKAALIEEHKQPFVIKQIPTPTPGRGEVLVKVVASGLCHTDVHAVDGDWPAATKLPLTPGHEGAGIVVAIGQDVSNLKVGDRVGYPWLGSSCGTCEFDMSGRESLCPTQQNTGYSRDGAFAEYMVAVADHVALIPEGLSFEQASPILCAGVTVYAGLKHTEARPGHFMTIIGAGGGLGHLALQYASAMGMRVVAVDMPDKLDFCRGLGAEFAFDATSQTLVDDVLKTTDGGSHGVLCVAASLSAFKAAEGMCRRGGTIVLIGLPKGDLPLNIFNVVIKGITIRGSIVGTRQDLVEALDFAARGRVHCEIEMHSFDDLNQVFDMLRKGQLKGRAVLAFTDKDAA